MTEIVHRTDEEFTKKYEESIPAVEKVAEWLQRRGHAAEVQPHILRPDVSQREEYTDDYDIHVKTRDGLIKVDAKGNPTYYFTTDKPWHLPTIICQSVYDVNRKGWPNMVFQVNRDLSCAVMMDVKAIRKYLFKKEIFNKSTKKPQLCWVCPMEHTVYVDLNK